MSRRALPWITAAMLSMAACGDLIQIGAQGDVTLPSPPDACSTLKCGEPCPLTACTSNECPPSVGGFCNLDGVCVDNTPVCTSSCAGLPCGAPCGSCDPDNPNCTVLLDAGPGSPAMVCDAFQQCVSGPITCL